MIAPAFTNELTHDKNCYSGHSKGKKSDSGAISRVVLFRFPEKAMIKNRWIRALHMFKWSPKPNSVLCSLHFDEDSFLPGSLNDPLQRPKLKLNAVPTIFDHDKKKTARKQPKNRSATTAPPKFSSLLPISSENQQNVEINVVGKKTVPLWDIEQNQIENFQRIEIV